MRSKNLRNRQASQYSFARIPKVTIPRSQFMRNRSFKTTFDAGQLFPLYMDFVFPGDTVNLRMNSFSRLATALRPVMDNSTFSCFFFFVPWRLVWDHFNNFLGEQEDPDSSIAYLIPQMVSPTSMPTGYPVGSLQDFFGIPTQVPGLTHSVLPIRAYYKIWNYFFRDQNLQDSIVVPLDDGPDLYSEYPGVLPRGKRKDYLTGALPFPQKGAAVSIPLTGNAPVSGLGTGTNTWPSGPANFYEAGTVGAVSYPKYKLVNPAGSDTNLAVRGPSTGTGSPDVYADMSDVTAATINQLRQAIQLQVFLERMGRGGTRVPEINLSHFGVVTPDILQHPEYLGGNTVPISWTPVPQTSSSVEDGSPQANLTSYGTMISNGAGFIKSFVEHGVIIGVGCVDAELTYQSGLNRIWSYRAREEFYWPAFANLGEQAILNKEIFAVGSGIPGQDDLVWAYAGRYSELKYGMSLITGAFRSSYATSLDTYHLSEEFSVLPEFNDDFIVSNPPFERVLVVTEGEPQFLFDAFFEEKWARCMPLYEIPGGITSRF